MGVKCILLYKLPKGMTPVREDVDRLVNALTQQLYCVPDTAGRSLRDAYSATGDKAVEAVATIYKQQQAPDTSIIKEPKSLQDFWLFKLLREAPAKACVLIKHLDHHQPYRVTEVEPSLKAFLEKRLDYKQRGSIYIQSQSWHMGDKGSDVTVKLLTVSQHINQPPRVLALEVTYHPACMLDQAAPVLQELAQQIISAVGPGEGQNLGQAGTLVLLSPRYCKPPRSNDPNDPAALFGPPHMVELYTELIQEGFAAR